tara:strand:+ start:1762 stop:4785 length:3024 start_codon:yes stop_codon:yes gene_type:complete
MVIRNVPTQRLSVPTSRVSGRPLTDTKAMKTNLLLKTAEAIQDIGNEISNRYSENQYDEFVTQFEQDNAKMFEENTRDINKYGEFESATKKGFNELEKNILKKSKNLNPTYQKRLKKYLLSRSTENLTKSISAASTAERAVIPNKIKKKQIDLLLLAQGMNPDSPYFAENLNNYINYVKSQSSVIGDAAVEINIMTAKASLEEAYVDTIIKDPDGNYGQFLPELSTLEPARGPREGISPYKFKYLTQERINLLQGRARTRLDEDKKARAKALKDLQDATDTQITNALQNIQSSTKVINGNISITESISGLDAIKENIDVVINKQNQIDDIILKSKFLKPEDKEKLIKKSQELKETQIGTKANYKLMYSLMEETQEIISKIENGSLDFVPDDFGDKYKQEFLKLSNKYSNSNPVLAKHFSNSAKEINRVKDKVEKKLLTKQELVDAIKEEPENRTTAQKTLVEKEYIKSVTQKNAEITNLFRKIKPKFNEQNIPILQILNNPEDPDFYEALKIPQEWGILPENALNSLESTFLNVDPKDIASRNEGTKAILTIMKIGDALSNTEIQNGNYYSNNDKISKAIRIIKNNYPNIPQTEAGLTVMSALVFQGRMSEVLIPTSADAGNPKLIITQNIVNPSITINSNLEGSKKRTYNSNIKEAWDKKRSSWFGPDKPPMNDYNAEIVLNVTKELMVRSVNQPGFDLAKYNIESNIWDSDLYSLSLQKVLDRVSIDNKGRLTIDGIDSVVSKLNHHPKTIKNNFAMQLFNELPSSEIQKLIDEGILTRIKLKPKSSPVKQVAPDSVFYPVPYNKNHLENNYHKNLTLGTYERMFGFVRDGENSAITFTEDIGFNRSANIKITEDIGVNNLTFEEYLTFYDGLNKSPRYSNNLESVNFLQNEYKKWSREGITKRSAIVPGYILTDKSGNPLFGGRVFSMPRSKTTKNELLYDALKDKKDREFLRFLRVNAQGGSEAKKIKENLSREGMKFLFQDRLSLEQLLKLNDQKMEVLGDL